MRLVTVHPRLLARHDHVAWVKERVGEVKAALCGRVVRNGRFRHAVGVGIALIVIAIQAGEGILVALPLRGGLNRFRLRARLCAGAAEREGDLRLVVVRLAAVHPRLLARHAHVAWVDERVGDIHLPHAAHAGFAVFRAVGHLIAHCILGIVDGLHHFINVAVSLVVVALQTREGVCVGRIHTPAERIAIGVCKVALPAGALFCALALQREGEFGRVVMLRAAVNPGLGAGDDAVLIIHDGIGDVHDRQAMLVKGRDAIVGLARSIRIRDGIGDVWHILRLHHAVVIRIAIGIVCGQVAKRIAVSFPREAARARGVRDPAAVVGPALQRQRHILRVVVRAPAVDPGLCALKGQLALRHGVGHRLAIRAVRGGVALRHILLHQAIRDGRTIHARRQGIDRDLPVLFRFQGHRRAVHLCVSHHALKLEAERFRPLRGAALAVHPSLLERAAHGGALVVECHAHVAGAARRDLRRSLKVSIRNPVAVIDLLNGIAARLKSVKRSRFAGLKRKLAFAIGRAFRTADAIPGACHRRTVALEDKLEGRHGQRRARFSLEGRRRRRHRLGHAQAADHRQRAGQKRNRIVPGDLFAVHADRGAVDLVGSAARVKDLACAGHAQRDLLRRNAHQVFGIDDREAALPERKPVVGLALAVCLQGQGHGIIEGHDVLRRILRDDDGPVYRLCAGQHSPVKARVARRGRRGRDAAAHLGRARLILCHPRLRAQQVVMHGVLRRDRRKVQLEHQRAVALDDAALDVRRGIIQPVEQAVARLIPLVHLGHARQGARLAAALHREGGITGIQTVAVLEVEFHRVFGVRIRNPVAPEGHIVRRHLELVIRYEDIGGIPAVERVPRHLRLRLHRDGFFKRIRLGFRQLGQVGDVCAAVVHVGDRIGIPVIVQAQHVLLRILFQDDLVHSLLMRLVARKAGEDLHIRGLHFGRLAQVPAAGLLGVCDGRPFHKGIAAIQLLLVILHPVGFGPDFFIVEGDVDPPVFLSLHGALGGDLGRARQLIAGDLPVAVYLDGFGQVVLLGRHDIPPLFIHIVNGQRPGGRGHIVDRDLLILLGQLFANRGEDRDRPPALKLGKVGQACIGKVFRRLGKLAVGAARPHGFLKRLFRPLAKHLGSAFGIAREDIAVPDRARRLPAGVHVPVAGDGGLLAPTDGVILVQIPADERIGQQIFLVCICGFVKHILIGIKVRKALAVCELAELGHHERIGRNLLAVAQRVGAHVVVRHRVGGRRPLGIHHQVGRRHGIRAPVDRNLEALVQIPACKHIVRLHIVGPLRHDFGRLQRFLVEVRRPRAVHASFRAVGIRQIEAVAGVVNLDVIAINVLVVRNRIRGPHRVVSACIIARHAEPGRKLINDIQTARRRCEIIRQIPASIQVLRILTNNGAGAGLFVQVHGRPVQIGGIEAAQIGDAARPNILPICTPPHTAPAILAGRRGPGHLRARGRGSLRKALAIQPLKGHVAILIGQVTAIRRIVERIRHRLPVEVHVDDGGTVVGDRLLGCGIIASPSISLLRADLRPGRIARKEGAAQAMILGPDSVDPGHRAHVALKGLGGQIVVGLVFIRRVVGVPDALHPVNHLVVGTRHGLPAHFDFEIVGRHAARRIVLHFAAGRHPLPILIRVFLGKVAGKRVAGALHRIRVRQQQRRAIAHRAGIHRRAAVVIDGIGVHLAVVVHIHHRGSARHDAPLHDLLLNEAFNLHITHFGHAARDDGLPRLRRAIGIGINSVGAYLNPAPLAFDIMVMDGVAIESALRIAVVRRILEVIPHRVECLLAFVAHFIADILMDGIPLHFDVGRIRLKALHGGALHVEVDGAAILKLCHIGLLRHAAVDVKHVVDRDGIGAQLAVSRREHRILLHQLADIERRAG